MVSAQGGTLAAAYSEQASVADWPLRIALTLGVLAVIALLLLAARWGWRRRERRQGFGSAVSSASPQNPGQVQAGGAPALNLPAKYLGTALADNLFERVVAGGGPAQVTLVVADGGFAVMRGRTRRLPVDLPDVSEVATGPGLLQKSYHRHGVLLVTWTWDERDVVSGFWIADASDQERALESLTDALSVSASTGGEQE